MNALLAKLVGNTAAAPAATPCHDEACGNGPKLRLQGASNKAVPLTELAAGQKGRIVRVNLPELGCKRRFGELGLAPGMTVTVISTGESIMLDLAGGKFGLAARCASEITVLALK